MDLDKFFSPRKTSCEAYSTLDEFIEHVYFPFYRRKRKKSTIMTNEQRLKQHLIPEGITNCN